MSTLAMVLVSVIYSQLYSENKLKEIEIQKLKEERELKIDKKFKKEVEYEEVE